VICQATSDLDEHVQNDRDEADRKDQDDRRQIQGGTADPNRWNDRSDGSQHGIDDPVEEFIQPADRVIVCHAPKEDDVGQNDPNDQCEREKIRDPVDEFHATDRPRTVRAWRVVPVLKHRERRRSASRG